MAGVSYREELRKEKDMRAKLALASALSLLAMTGFADAARKGGGDPGGGNKVSVRGCPYVGVENCLFINSPSGKV
jgi:hypothetical protein